MRVKEIISDKTLPTQMDIRRSLLLLPNYPKIVEMLIMILNNGL